MKKKNRLYVLCTSPVSFGRPMKSPGVRPLSDDERRGWMKTVKKPTNKIVAMSTRSRAHQSHTPPAQLIIIIVARVRMFLFAFARSRRETR